MSEVIYSHALWLVIAWPLFLASPALHSRLPWSRHLAIIPALTLTLFSGDVSLELPWFLFGTGFAIDNEIRWILLMSVATWVTAATITNSSTREPADDRMTTFFMLILTGNLGAILTTDLVGFFSFSTLMGYGFYGLLLHNANKEIRHAGRLYLMFLIVADLFLFETLLLAASTTENLQFEAVRHAMSSASSSQFYIWITIVGFVIKAGILPAHLWLTAVYKSAHQSVTLLLGGVPVAMGLLGLVRWLPLGEQHFLIPGTVLQVTGAAGMLYAALMYFTHAPVKLVPAWLAVAATGLFIASMGTGLAHPLLWHQFEYLAYPFIASLGILLAVIPLAIARLPAVHQYPDSASQLSETLYLWTERFVGVVSQWARQRLFSLQSLRDRASIQSLKYFQRALERKAPGTFLTDWGIRIILFVMLGLALVWLA